VAELTFQFIGSGNAFAPGGLCWNGFVANGRYLFETPPQALMALNRLNINPNDLECVVISHHHGDHFLGLPFLLLHWKHLGRGRPVTIVGPRGTRALAQAICDRTYPGVMDAPYGIDWIEAEPTRPIIVAGLQLTPVEVNHDPRLSQNLGYACTLDDRTFAYTGDSAICDGVLSLARQAEVLVSECTSRAEVIPLHMNLVDDMRKLRAALAPEATLLLTHLDADVASGDEIGELHRTVVARDFGSFRF